MGNAAGAPPPPQAPAPAPAILPAPGPSSSDPSNMLMRMFGGGRPLPPKASREQRTQDKAEIGLMLETLHAFRRQVEAKGQEYGQLAKAQLARRDEPSSVVSARIMANCMEASRLIMERVESFEHLTLTISMGQMSEQSLGIMRAIVLEVRQKIANLGGGVGIEKAMEEFEQTMDDLKGMTGDVGQTLSSSKIGAAESQLSDRELLALLEDYDASPAPPTPPRAPKRERSRGPKQAVRGRPDRVLQ